MGEIATSERQITLYCNSNSSRAKQTLAFAKAEGVPVLVVDMLKTKITGTQIVELSDRLGVEIRDLVNQDHPSYTMKFEHHDLSSEDWIKMIQNNPGIMKQPIALRGDITILVETPSDIIKI
ncbi:hypothetical protein HPE56_11560 [Maribacter sp. ANRC-HE7]|uniref:Arsenate reductase n=1 Tax=Maribacter aquimaris TaxID=2737171 RepID=A0ABR7V1T5_9FLAO|nr:hypothetical protein [Maribacter aquimaris]MBD0778432.1 hypothetical protein [Maribacter aquimaris]